jgi:S-disulfanyl-L-cysteine oxidoreductase SoxD
MNARCLRTATVLATLAALVVARSATAEPEAAHFGDADHPATVLAGQRLYKTHCAQCHGRTLQGQALWRLEDEYAHQRAPALDGTGHAWQHSDEALYQRIRVGRWPDAPDGPLNPMPRYQSLLSESDTEAVIAFLKSRWGVGLRAAQSTLNPDLRGMPLDAADSDWTLPPTCSSTQQQWRSVSATPAVRDRNP